MYHITKINSSVVINCLMDLSQFMYHSIYYMYIIQTSFRGTIDLLKLIVQEVPSSLSPSGVLPPCAHIRWACIPYHIVSLTKYYKYIETLHVKIIYCCTCIVYMYMYCGGRYLMYLIRISFTVLPDINLVVF